MAEHELVIRGGTVIDGTGADRRVADVAVSGGRITGVGKVEGRATREIDAEGHLVLPGWVDIHTHYDGQATWDPTMTPSAHHGVTTAVFGNCGVGFAPVRPGNEGFLINLMEGVEDIPGTALAEGIDFRWTSVADYLDVLDEQHYTMDIGAQIPHGALRVFVMGDRGADHDETPTDEECAKMGRLVEEALQAGALGFTTSRTTKHRAKDGRPTPSLSAAEPELVAIAEAMAAAGRGVIQANSDFGPGEFDTLHQMAQLAGRPLSVLLLQVDNAPDLWRETLAGIHAARRAGIEATGQVGVRPIGVLMGLDASIHPFVAHPAYRAVADLPLAERAARLATDDALRRRLIEEAAVDAFSQQWLVRGTERTYELGDPLDYEPDPANSLAARARAAGRHPLDLVLELLCADEGRNLLLHPFENYTGGNLDVVREMLADPYTVCGLGDGGAHVATICDASYPTFLLTHWARDRHRGERLALEQVVRKQTGDTARVYGLADRGVVAAGYRADLNIVDFANLGVTRPELVRDLPAGGKRLVQRATGYRHTFVAGVEVAAAGELTGARPGRLVRGPRSVGSSGRPGGASPS